MTGISSHFSKQNWLDQARYGKKKIALRTSDGTAVLYKAKSNLFGRAFGCIHRRNHLQERNAAFKEFKNFILANYGEKIANEIFENALFSPKDLTGRSIAIAIAWADDSLQSSGPYERSSPMERATIDRECTEKFRQKAKEFELKLAQQIMKDDRVGQTVDTMLDKVYKIVNARAKATGRSFNETYRREFGFERGEKYHGSLSAGNDINSIFQDKTQPMSVKLKLIYNAVGNNNFRKYAANASGQNAGYAAPRKEAARTETVSLMLQTAKDLGMDDTKDLKAMRLALTGWMVASNEQSLHDVFKTARRHGVTFESKQGDRGNLYESESNFDPMGTKDFSQLLPEKKFPSFFRSKEYKDIVATQTRRPNSPDIDSLKASLGEKGIPNHILKNLGGHAMIDLAKLDDVVGKHPINKTYPMSSKSGGLRRACAGPLSNLSRAVGAKKAQTMMDALIKFHHPGKGMAPSETSVRDTMADIGIPDSVLRSLQPSSLTDLEAVRHAAQNALYDPNTRQLSWAPPNNGEMERLSSHLGQDNFDNITALFLQTYQGNQAIGTNMAQKADAARNIQHRGQVDQNAAFIAPYFNQDMHAANDTINNFLAKGVSRQSIIPAFKMAMQFLNDGKMNWADAMQIATDTQKFLDSRDLKLDMPEKLAQDIANIASNDWQGDIRAAQNLVENIISNGVNPNSVTTVLDTAKHLFFDLKVNWSTALTKACLVQQCIQKGQIDPNKFKESIPSQTDIYLAGMQGHSNSQVNARKKIATFSLYTEGIGTRQVQNHLQRIDFNKPM